MSYVPKKPPIDISDAFEEYGPDDSLPEQLINPVTKAVEKAYVAGWDAGWECAEEAANCWTEDAHIELISETFGMESLPEFSELLKDLVRALSADGADGERLVPYGEVEAFFFRTPARDLAALKVWAG